MFFRETDVPSCWPDVSLSVAFAPSESFSSKHNLLFIYRHFTNIIEPRTAKARYTAHA
jgi:hypothetical protein